MALDLELVYYWRGIINTFHTPLLLGGIIPKIVFWNAILLLGLPSTFHPFLMLFFWNAILSLRLQSTFHQFPLGRNWGKWVDNHEGKHKWAQVDKCVKHWADNITKPSLVGVNLLNQRIQMLLSTLENIFTSRFTKPKVNKTKNSSMLWHLPIYNTEHLSQIAHGPSGV